MHLAMVGRDREVRTISPVSNQEEPKLYRRSGRPSGGVAVPRLGVSGSSLDVAGEERRAGGRRRQNLGGEVERRIGDLGKVLRYKFSVLQGPFA
jgi:hypothetical protein